MPAAEFERNRSAVISSKLSKERALTEEADRHWDALWHRHWDWALREREAAALAEISQREMCDWFAAHLAPREGGSAAAGPPRRKLAVRVAAAGRAGAERAAAAADAKAAGAVFAEEEEGVEALRAAWGFYPPAPTAGPPGAA
jgi:hypothetical protein